MKRRVVPGLLAVACGLTVSLPATSGSALDCASSAVSLPDLAYYHCYGVHPGVRVKVVRAKGATTYCAGGFLYGDTKGQRYLSIPGTCGLEPEDCAERKVIVLPNPKRPGIDPFPGDVSFPGVDVPRLEDEIEQLVCTTLATPPDGEVTFRKDPPVVYDYYDNTRIGIVTYAANKEGVNFGLVRLDRGVRSDPAVPYFGGPTRLDNSVTYGPTFVDIYEPSSGPQWVGAGFNVYQGLAPNGLSGDPIMVEPIGSDYLSAAGSLVLGKDGSAIGIVPYNYLGYHSVFRLKPALDRAASVGKLKVTLLTAPAR